MTGIVLVPTPQELRSAKREAFLIGLLVGAAFGAFGLGLVLEHLGRLCP